MAHFPKKETPFYGVQPSPMKSRGTPYEERPWLPKVVGIVALLLMIAFFWRFCYSPPLPGVGRLPQPIQKRLSKPKQLPAPDGYNVTANYSYEIKALILARKRYSDGVGGMFSPVDFALGWGVMTMKPYVNMVKWTQRGRWYNTSYGSDFPLTNRHISLNSANTHIIPAWGQADLRAKLIDFGRGDLVKLRGYLVVVRANVGGWRWVSSTRRDDTAGGACEVFYVTHAERLPLPK